jgi:hypothetical protein
MSDRVRSNVRSRGTPRPFPPPQSSGTFSEKKPRAFPSPAHCRTLRKHLASTARKTCETLTTVYTSNRAPIGAPESSPPLQWRENAANKKASLRDA